MILSAVLISVEKAMSKKVKEELDNLSYIGVAELIFGLWDVIAIIRCESLKEIGEAKIEIEGIDGVRSALTMVMGSEELILLNWLKG